MAAPASKAVATTLESIARTKPAYADLVKTFSPLMAKQAELAETFAAQDIFVPEVDAARLGQEVHVLAGISCEHWIPQLETAAKEMLPLLKEMIPDEAWPGKKDCTDPLDGATLARLAEARLGGDQKTFDDVAKTMEETPAPVLFAIAENILGPVLSWVAKKLNKSLSDVPWDKGHCPICGSLPSIAYLSRKEQLGLDQLVGGGGKKHLHCSLCGHDWAFRRDTCPACGNTDSKTRELFYAEDAKHERIEACQKCGTYCLCIDLRECDPVPQMDAVQLGLIHLNVIARDKKLAPMVKTTWNSIES
jgi:FdhE protein